MTVQTRGTLDRELHSIEENLLRLGSRVGSAVQQSLRALAERDIDLAQQVIAEDAAINDLRFEIEELCLATVATQQPMAGDLREIMAAIVIATELERMGDHAAGIAKMVLRMEEEPQVALPPRILSMAEMCQDMLRKSLDAFMARDAGAAYAIAARDDDVDRQHRQLFQELVSSTLAHESDSSVALNLLFASHNLERIADRITNIAERVIFVAEGKLQELNVNR